MIEAMAPVDKTCFFEVIIWVEKSVLLEEAMIFGSSVTFDQPMLAITIFYLIAEITFGSRDGSVVRGRVIMSIQKPVSFTVQRGVIAV